MIREIRTEVLAASDSPKRGDTILIKNWSGEADIAVGRIIEITGKTPSDMVRARMLSGETWIGFVGELKAVSQGKWEKQ